MTLNVAEQYQTRDTILVFLLVLVSGNPAFSSAQVAPFILVIIMLIAFSKRSVPEGFLRRFWPLGAGFALIGIAHFVQFGQVAPAAHVYFIAKIFIGGFVISSVGERFPEKLFTVVFWMSASSLVLQLVLVVVGPDRMPGFIDEELLGPNIKTMLIFSTLMTDEWWRNSSMMWEPGAFQGVINISLALLTASAWLERTRRFRMLIILIGLLSTFSTTGYLVFFILVILKLLQFNLPLSIRILLALLATTAIALAFNEFGFLGEKISHQLSNTNVYGNFSPDRFGAFLFDLQYIEKYPLFGNGLSDFTRYADHPHLEVSVLGHGNGFSNFIATFGLVGAALYFGSLLMGKLSPTFAGRAIFTTLMAIILFGEQFLNFPLFLGLGFVCAPAGAMARPMAFSRQINPVPRTAIRHQTLL